MNENWYNIKNEAGGTADVYIFDEIGMWGITAQSFITDIKDLDKTPINLHINSLGGDVFDGMAIYNVLKKRTARTTVYIEGIAASIATIIALGGDEVIMSENSLFMIHNAWSGAMGEADDMRKAADLLDKIGGELKGIYMKKVNLSVEALTDMMDKETWLSAEEALAHGFITSISDAIKVAASYDVSKFKNITNEQIKNKLSININNKKMTNELKDWFNNKVEEIVATVKGDVKVSEDVVNQTEISVKLSDNEEIMNKISEFETTNIDLTNKITALEEELVTAKGTNETLNGEVEDLNASINKAEAKGTDTENDSDPVIVVEPAVVNANAGFHNMVAEMIRTRVNN
jgi:ATP-dependent Clp endopeptidase proteolytic subunit ClpP